MFLAFVMVTVFHAFVIAMVSSAFLLHFSGVGLCTGAAGVPDSPPGAAHKNATVQSCS